MFLVQVKASDPSVISGYLLMSSNARSWQRRWFAVHKDFVLYSFKAHQVSRHQSVMFYLLASAPHAISLLVRRHETEMGWVTIHLGI